MGMTIDQEPTIKNDLGVDCIVDILGSYTDLDIPYKREIAEDILTKLSSVTPQEPFINKPCVSAQVCEHDKNVILGKIRAEIEELDGKYVIGDYGIYGKNSPKYVRLWEVLQIIDKYKAESEVEDGECK